MLSFVVPAWNEAGAIGPTLDAIHAAARAAGRAYEIVVADDASTDATAALATAAGARVLPVSFRQISRTRNAGAAAARGDVLVFVDADTLLPEATLRAALAALDAGAVGGGATVAFEAAAPGWTHRAGRVVIESMRLMGLAAGCFVFCRRADFEAVGGFDPGLYAGEEVWLSRALGRRGRFVILRERVVTSARKAQGRTLWGSLVLAVRILARGPRGLRRREGNEFWYDGRR